LTLRPITLKSTGHYWESLYFDTCAYSTLLDATEPELYAGLRERLRAAAVEIVLSPVNIVEFLQTTDQLRRERLVFLAQNVCGPQLLAEIEAILTHFIAERSGRHDLAPFILKSALHTDRLGSVWADLYADHRRTFVFEPSQLRRFEVLRQAVNFFHAHYRRGGTLADVEIPTPLLELDSLERVTAILRSAAAERRKSSAPESVGSGNCGARIPEILAT